MIVVVMGVTGTGKSSVAHRLAEELRLSFVEGDDFHDQASIEKMGRGEPLTEQDRQPWLDRLNGELRRHEPEGSVLACSALTASSRRRLADGLTDVRFVFLRGRKDVLRHRLEKREGHFAGAELLDSQLDTLEVPEDAVLVDVGDPLEVVLAHALAGLRG